MISSMTLRGSRIELAVFTMSVRMARRAWPCAERGPGVAGAPRLGLARARDLELGEHLARGGIARPPGRQEEVEAQLARTASARRRRPRSGDAADRPARAGSGASGLEGRARARGADLHERPVEARLVEAPRGGRADTGKNS